MFKDPTIVSYLTIFAAVIAPVLTALITQIGAYKTKTTEIYFAAKLDAYTKFMEVASNVFTSNADTKALENAAYKARLFATPSVDEKIKRFTHLASSHIDVQESLAFHPCEEIYSEDEYDDLTAAEYDVIFAIQNDLRNTNLKRKFN